MPKNEGQSNREYCEAQGPSSGNDRTLSFTERQYYTILRKKNQTEEMVSKYSDIDGKIKDFQASIMSYGLRLGMSKGDFREKHLPVYKEALLAVKEFKDLQTHIESNKNRGIKEYDWEDAHITANDCKHDVDRFFRKNVEETLLLIFDKGVEQYSNLKKSMLDQPGIQQSLEDVDGHFNSLCRHVKENLGKLDNLADEDNTKIMRAALGAIDDLENHIGDLRDLQQEDPLVRLFSKYPDIHANVENIRKYGTLFEMSEEDFQEKFPPELEQGIENYENLRKALKDVNEGKEVKGFKWKEARKTAEECEKLFDKFFENNENNENNENIFKKLFDKGLDQYNSLRDKFGDHRRPEIAAPLQRLDECMGKVREKTQDIWTQFGNSADKDVRVSVRVSARVSAFTSLSELEKYTEQLRQLQQKQVRVFSQYPNMPEKVNKILNCYSFFGMLGDDFQKKFPPELEQGIEKYQQLQRDLKAVKKGKGVKEFNWENAYITSEDCIKRFDKFFKDTENSFRTMFNEGFDKYRELRNSSDPSSLGGTASELHKLDKKVNRINQIVQDNWNRLGNLANEEIREGALRNLDKLMDYIKQLQQLQPQDLRQPGYSTSSQPWQSAHTVPDTSSQASQGTKLETRQKQRGASENVPGTTSPRQGQPSDTRRNLGKRDLYVNRSGDNSREPLSNIAPEAASSPVSTGRRREEQDYEREFPGPTSSTGNRKTEQASREDADPTRSTRQKKSSGGLLNKMFGGRKKG